MPDSPVWLTADQLHSSLDATLLDWLFDEGSLTRRLTAHASGAFSIQTLSEGWQPLRAEECERLDVPAASEGWVREVLLCGHEMPWVYARSVASRESLMADGLDLQSLGQRSLGELLFSDRAFSRGPLRACRYPEAWLPETVRQPGLWGRRSCFSRGPLHVLVTEVFLPSLWDAPQH
ncbi:chorismate--pyruvate lyase family protein [Stutzerimonas tarimensis]|uniref:Probable chorismate pyruvate-lyase n=1 Tax=Stutzerimonas tarimensis TaxID=1507735 RepID=A0ABV7T2Z6_9GAMM